MSQWLVQISYWIGAACVAIFFSAPFMVWYETHPVNIGEFGDFVLLSLYYGAFGLILAPYITYTVLSDLIWPVYEGPRECYPGLGFLVLGGAGIFWAGLFLLVKQKIHHAAVRESLGFSRIFWVLSTGSIAGCCCYLLLLESGVCL